MLALGVARVKRARHGRGGWQCGAIRSRMAAEAPSRKDRAMTDRPEPPPEQLLMQLALGKFVTRALTAVADVGVADHIDEAPVAAAALAAKTGTHADALGRVLRCLAAVGVFAETGEGFAHTPASRRLRTDDPQSMRAMVRWINCKPAWDAWGRLDHSLATGEPAFDLVHGTHVFDYFARDPDTAKVFNDAMTSFSAMTGHAVAEAYDFGGIDRLVDVGGGHGALLAAICTRHPNVRGVVFDLPDVVAGAPAVLGELVSRIDTAGGDFFAGVPAGADAYIMKHIIHDWDDARCVQLLTHCAAGLNDGGKVLIVEQLVTDRPEATFAKLLDLEMLAMTRGGRERTEDEFAALYRKAGLRMTGITPTQSPVVVVEGVRA